MPRGKRQSIWIVIVMAWAVGVGAGAWWLTDYSTRPGDPGHPRPQWPAAAPVPLDLRRPTVVMIAHPRCPCTAASIAELETLLAEVGEHVRAWVVISLPSGAAGTDAWETGPLQRRLAAIPGLLTRVMDSEDAAARFGAATSGHLLVYAPDGALRFSGGITPARGHRGDNSGSAAVRDLARNQKTFAGTTPVFGCPLTRADAGDTP